MLACSSRPFTKKCYTDMDSDIRSSSAITKLPRATLNQKIEVLDYLVGPPSKSQIATLNHFRDKQEFAISQATLSNWVSSERVLRHEYNSNPNLKSYKKKPVLKYPDVTVKVENYISNFLSNGIEVDDKLIRETYLKVMDELGYSISDFKLSTGMLKSFKKRNTLNVQQSQSPPVISQQHQQQQQQQSQNQYYPNGLQLQQNNQSSRNNSQQDCQQNQMAFNASSQLDFNFDEIFNNNNPIGFNTRLIHSADTISLLPSSLNNDNLDNNSNFQLSLGIPSSMTFSTDDTKLSPLLSANPLPANIQSPTDLQLLTNPNSNLVSNILPSPTPPTASNIEKRKLPYYPTYKNPLSDSTSYKRIQQRQSKTFTNSIGSKFSNPNSEKIEKILENITDGYVTLYNSGTSAIMGILSFLNPDYIYIDDEGYKGTHNVIKFLNKLTNVKKLSLSTLHTNSKILKNSVVIIESPMNPLGYVPDVSYYSNIIKNSNSNPNDETCKLIIDSTLAPPPLQFPFKNGADYIVYSAVKYIAGVSDLSAGFIVSKAMNSKKELHLERNALGTSIGNFDSFLLVRSLRTYKMRILTQCNNTEKILKFLQKNLDKYKSVLFSIHHASLQANKVTVMKQLNGFYNPVFALELEDITYPEKLLNKFNFLSNNPNLEGGETLVELIYGNPNFNNDENNIINGGNSGLFSSGNHRKMLRFSVGCEDFQDIIRDIDQALMSLIK